MALTPKQETFCKEYIRTGNGTEAYRQAYDVKKSTPKSIHENASRLLKNAKVASRIGELQGIINEKFEVSILQVLQEYAKIAFFDPRKMFDATTGALIPVAKMEADVAAALAGFEVDTKFEDGELIRASKVKLNSKVAALDSLARHLGMFQKDNEQGKDRLVIIKDFTGGTE